jgi:hypothetical protein
VTNDDCAQSAESIRLNPESAQARGHCHVHAIRIGSAVTNVADPKAVVQRDNIAGIPDVIVTRLVCGCQRHDTFDLREQCLHGEP